jgi:hypothetical protein
MGNFTDVKSLFERKGASYYVPIFISESIVLNNMQTSLVKYACDLIFVYRAAEITKVPLGIKVGVGLAAIAAAAYLAKNIGDAATSFTRSPWKSKESLYYGISRPLLEAADMEYKLGETTVTIHPIVVQSIEELKSIVKTDSRYEKYPVLIYQDKETIKYSGLAHRVIVNPINDVVTSYLVIEPTKKIKLHTTVEDIERAIMKQDKKTALNLTDLATILGAVKVG